MDENGFSLVEMVVVLFLCSILIAMATLQWDRWTVKSSIETQFKRLFSDLQGVRAQALYRKQSNSVVFMTASSCYYIYSSTVTSVRPKQKTRFKIPVTVSTNLQVSFDQTGFATFSNNSTTVNVCAAGTNASKAFFNSVIISQTRTQIGNQTGAGCVGANITPQ